MNGDKHDNTRSRGRSKAKTDESSSKSSSSSDDLPNDSDDDSASDHSYKGAKYKSHSSRSSSGRIRKVHFVPFTAKKWQVWFAKFKDITKRKKWSDRDKLDMLIPKLQGDAGEFVFD